MDLVLKLNDQLEETEKELGALIKMKQSDLATTSKDVIPVVSTIVPSTLAASLARTAPPATTFLVTTNSTTAAGASGEKAVELVKAMEGMSIQAMEINKLRENVASLEPGYKLAQFMQRKEAENAQRISERIKVLEKDLTLEKPLGKTKEMLWANIIDFVNDILPSIQVIFKQT